MIENLQKLSCGECGYNEFELYDNETDRDNSTVMVSECVRCRNKTIIEIKFLKPELVYKFEDNSNGILCHLS